MYYQNPGKSGSIVCLLRGAGLLSSADVPSNFEVSGSLPKALRNHRCWLLAPSGSVMARTMQPEQKKTDNWLVTTEQTEGT